MPNPVIFNAEVYSGERQADPLDKAFLPHYRITVRKDNRILVESGSGLERKTLLKEGDRVTIGRSLKMHIVIPTSCPDIRKVSGHHGELYLAQEERTKAWKYRDCGSNGTYLNGKPLPKGAEALLRGPAETLSIPHPDLIQLILHFAPQA